MNVANSSVAVNPALTEGSASVVTVTARDQYNNPMSGVQFKYDLTITNNDSATNETYVVDGSTLTNVHSPGVDLSQSTDTNGQVQFNVTMPETVDSDDGISLQVKVSSNPYESVGAPISFTK